MHGLNSSACLVLCVTNALSNSVTDSCFIWVGETVYFYNHVVCKYLCLYIILTFSYSIVCLSLVATSGSVVLTQTHPAAPYVCRTGNISLRCQYGGVGDVVSVLWVIGTKAGTVNPSTIPGHTALPRTTTYEELVVDSYTNVREKYQCGPALPNGSALSSNVYEPQIECKLDQSRCTKLWHACVPY